MDYIDIYDSDGNRNTINVPEYARDDTLKEYLAIAKKMSADDKKMLAQYEKMLDTLKDARKDEKDRAEEQKRQLDAIKKASEDTADEISNQGEQKKIDTEKFNERLKMFGSSLMDVSGIAFKMGAALVTATSMVTGIIGRSTLTLGSTIAQMTEFGVGFDDMRGTTVDTIASLARLGLTTDQAATLMIEASGALQQLGKREFVNVQKQFASLTNYGSQFAMTMAEASSILAEDLSMRQRLGFLDQIEAQSEARRSQELYAAQIEMTTTLGKNIQDIRDQGKNLIADSAQIQLQVLRISAGNEKLARDITQSVEYVSGKMRSIGVDPNITNQIVNQMFEPIAFMGQQGQELRNVFTMMGDGGKQLINMVTQANRLYNIGDAEAAQRMMRRVPEEMLDAVADMGSDDFNQFLIQLDYLGASGEQAAKMFGEMRVAGKQLQFDLQSSYPELATGSAQFTNAVNRLRGGVTSMLTSITAAFGPMLTGLTSAFDGDGGILDVLSKEMSLVGKHIRDKFLAPGQDFKDLGDMLKGRINPIIKQFGNSIKSFFDDWSPERAVEAVGDVVEGIFIVSKAFVQFSGMIVSLTKFLSRFFLDKNDEKEIGGVVVERNGVKVPLTEDEKKRITTATTSGRIGQMSGGYDVSQHRTAMAGEDTSQVGADQAGLPRIKWGAILSLILGYAAVKAVIFGTIGKIAASMTGAGAGVAGGAAAGAGKMGLFAKASKALGAASLGLLKASPAIAVIIGAIWGMGKALDAFPFEKFSNFIATVKNANTEREVAKIEAQGRVLKDLGDVSPEGFKNLAGGIDTVGESIVRLADSIGSDGFFFNSGVDVDKQAKQVGVFNTFAGLDAAKISTAGYAINVMASAYERISNIDGDALARNSETMIKLNRNAAFSGNIFSDRGALNSFRQSTQPQPMLPTTGDANNAATPPMRQNADQQEILAALNKLNTTQKATNNLIVKLDATIKAVG